MDLCFWAVTFTIISSSSLLPFLAMEFPIYFLQGLTPVTYGYCFCFFLRQHKKPMESWSERNALTPAGIRLRPSVSLECIMENALGVFHNYAFPTVNKFTRGPFFDLHLDNLRGSCNKAHIKSGVPRKTLS